MSDRDPALRLLSRAEVRKTLDSLVAIAADVPGEYWGPEHFLAERPGKWELSAAAWLGGAPVAYAIVSRRAPDQAHLHHLMVAPGHRDAGLGRSLLVFAMDHARSRGLQLMSLKVAEVNSDGRRFYERSGFTATCRDGSFVWLKRNLAAADQRP